MLMLVNLVVPVNIVSLRNMAILVNLRNLVIFVIRVVITSGGLHSWKKVSKKKFLCCPQRTDFWGNFVILNPPSP